MGNTEHYQVVIVGGGTAGITVAAKLARKLKSGSVAIIEPSRVHYYQPLWTLVGGGVFPKQKSARQEADFIPRGVTWIQEAVDAFQPDSNQLTTDSGRTLSYDCLVVAPGLQINWDRIPGLQEALGKDGVCSNYSYETVDKTWEFIRNFQGGTAIFTHPSTVVKCGGAPQKIMYLADDAFRKSGVRDKSRVVFASASGGIFAVKKYADALNRVIDRKGIDTMYRQNLVELRPSQHEAIFEHMDTGEKTNLHYDFIHVTPPMGPPDFVRHSPLANAEGWVDVDQHTLRHHRYPNVFSLGDAASLPTSKTGAAIRKQAPVLVENLMAVMQNREPVVHYDGYTSCPLVTGYGRLILAEFDYNLKPQETFPFDQSKERRSMYILKKDVLPRFYWSAMLKGIT
ncbi:MAG TPA: FAD/NAD(P)-binding oxidoreductase [Coleofasciculaceae cyanobacterium]|jgi:sulfide:quinone oxidoreductase